MYKAYLKSTGEEFASFPLSYTEEYVKSLLSQMGFKESEYTLQICVSEEE